MPAPFRAVLQGRGLTSLAIYPALSGTHLEGAGFDRYVDLQKGIADSFLPVPDNEAAEWVMGELHEFPLDGEGRIILLGKFLAKAGITGQAAFCGQGKYFEIWEPAALDAVKEAKRARVAAAMLQRRGGV